MRVCAILMANFDFPQWCHFSWPVSRPSGLNMEDCENEGPVMGRSQAQSARFSAAMLADAGYTVVLN